MSSTEMIAWARAVHEDRGRGGQVVSVWRYDERGSMVEDVAIVRRAVSSDVEMSRPRAASDWLRAILSEYR